MSGYLRTKIAIELKALEKAKTATELYAEPDQTLTTLENAILLESAAERIKSEVATVNAKIEQIWTTASKWHDLIQKMDKDERKSEQTVYDQFQTTEKLNTKMETANTKLTELKDLEMKVEAGAKLQRSKADRDARVEQREHAKAMSKSNTEADKGNSRARGNEMTAALYQLPTLRIKPFGGDKREWPMFEEAFKVAVDQKPGSKTEKLNLLKSLVEREAALLIGGLRLEEKNYEIAMKLLKDTYGDKGEYVRRLHTELSNLKRCFSVEDTKHFCMELERLARELEAAEEDIEGPPIYLMLEKKLYKPFLREILEEKAKNPDFWDTSSLRKALGSALSKELAIKEVMREYGFEGKEANPEHGFKRQLRRNRFGGSVNVATTHFGKPNGERRKIPEQKMPSPRQGQRSFQQMPQNPAFRERKGQGRSPKIQRNPTAVNTQGELLPCVFCGGKHRHDSCEKARTVQQRFAVLQEKGLCYKCLKSNHIGRNCPCPMKCFKCQQAHPTALCHQANPKRATEWRNMANRVMNVREEEKPDKRDEFKEVSFMPSQCNSVQGNSRVLLRTAEVTIFNPSNPKRSMVASVFVDDGSERSFIRANVAKQLGLPVIETEECHLTGFGEKEAKRYVSNVVRVGFLGVNGDPYICALNEMEFIVKAMPIVTLNSMDEAELSKKKLSLPSRPRQPDILLGMDVRHDLKIRDETEKLPSGFTLSTSRVGRMISGYGQVQGSMDMSVQVTYAGALISALQCVSSGREADEEIEEQIKTFFGLNIIGLSDNPEENGKEEVMRTFRKGLTFKEGRYECGLPWNERIKDLPTNFQQARARLCGTVKKLRELNLVDEYQKIFNEWEKNGIIERVPDPSQSTGPVHYLPHRPVIKMDKATTKIRIVMDASAKPANRKGAPSLNECLHTGPLLLNELTGILLRWRRMKHLILADIEKAFLQLSVREEDRDATRFLWLEDPQKTEISSPTYVRTVVFRFCRVSFGLTTSPFLLNATIREHLSFYDTALPQTILENLYVDNILINVKENEDILKICLESIELFRQGGMKLQEFFCSKPIAIRSLPAELLAKNQKEIKVLGIPWMNEEDEICFRLKKFAGKHTKRNILAHIAKIYDPLGLVAPAVLPAKHFLQKLFETKNGWDVGLKEELIGEWNQIMETWQTREGADVQIRFTRRIDNEDEEDKEMHCFADASGKGLGVAIYIRESNPKTIANLVFAKSLVKPSNISDVAATIPKMELQSITLGVKLLKYVLQHLKLKPTQTTIWTDSLCSVERIKEHKKCDRFVSNRLAKIRGQFEVKHLVSADNPADVASRGTTPRELSRNLLWKHGPKWLSEEKARWPKPAKVYHPDEEKLRGSAEDEETKTAAVMAEVPFQPTIDINRYSSWKKAKTVGAYVLRWIHLVAKNKYNGNLLPILSKMGPKKHWNKDEGVLSVPELCASEHWLLWEAQQQFPTEEKTMENLRLFKEKEIWRCQGRIGEATVKEETKFPIFLPPEAWTTKLIVLEAHWKMKHPSHATLLGYIREKYWIPKGRRFIRNTILSERHGCLNCRKERLKPYAYPQMPNLPRERVAMIRPFEKTGVDYFGPLTIKGGVKVYIALYTCLVIRAVHLEVADDCTATEFLRTFRRFSSRRGLPSLMWSDNGTNFIAGAECIKEEWRREILVETSHSGVSWKFNVPRAPWQGGAWERLVGITRSALRRTVGKSLMERQEFDTLVCEIEAVVNTRPLTFQSEEEFTQPLRPVDFLLPYKRVETSLPLSDEDPRDPDYAYQPRKKGELHQLMRVAIKRIDRFWKQWKTEYLLSLRERERTNQAGGSLPREGDIVLVEEEEDPRSIWTMGKVEKLLKGRDGLVRTARVHTKGKTLVRAINLLYPLEINTSAEDEVSQIQVTTIMDSQEAVMEGMDPQATTTESSLPPETVMQDSQIVTTESSLSPVRGRNERQAVKERIRRRQPTEEVRGQGRLKKNGPYDPLRPGNYRIPRRNPFIPSRVAYNEQTRTYRRQRGRRLDLSGLRKLFVGLGGTEFVRRELQEKANPALREERLRKDKVKFMEDDARRVAECERKAAEEKLEKSKKDFQRQTNVESSSGETTRNPFEPMEVLPGDPEPEVPLEELARQEKFDKEMALEQRKMYERRRAERNAEKDRMRWGLPRGKAPRKVHYAAQRGINKRRNWHRGRHLNDSQTGRKYRHPRAYDISPLRQPNGATTELLAPISEMEGQIRNDKRTREESQSKKPVQSQRRTKAKDPLDEQLERGKKCKQAEENPGRIKLAPARPGYRCAINYSLFTRCEPGVMGHEGCQRNCTMGSLSHGRLTKIPQAESKAVCLAQAFAFDWLGRMHAKKFNENWCALLGSGSEIEDSLKNWWMKELRQNEKTIPQKQLECVLTAWDNSCQVFGQAWKGKIYGPVALEDVPTKANGMSEEAQFESWLRNLTERFGQTLTKLRAKEYWKDCHLQSKRVLVVSNQEDAELVAKEFVEEGSSWFIHFGDKPLREKMFPVNWNIKIILNLELRREEKEELEVFKEDIKDMARTGLEVHLATRKNARLPREFEEFAEMQGCGIYQYDKIGELAAAIKGTPANTGTNPESEESVQKSSTGWRRAVRKGLTGMAMLVMLLITLLQPMMINGQVIRPERNDRWIPVNPFGRPLRMEELIGFTEPTVPRMSLDKRGQIAPTMPTTTSSMSIEHVREWYKKARKQTSGTTQTSTATTTMRTSTSASTVMTTLRTPETTATTRMTTKTQGVTTQPQRKTTNREPRTDSGRRQWTQTPSRRWTDRIRATTQAPSQVSAIPTTISQNPTEGAVTDETKQAARRLNRELEEVHRGADPIYWCAHKGSSLWRIPDADKSPFCKPPPGLSSHWKRLTISLYMPYRKPQKVEKAYRCAIKRTKEYFYTNLLGDQFVRTEKEFLPVQKRICMAMIEQHKCPYEDKPMTPIEGGGWSSNNPVNEEFPGRFSSLMSGERETVTLNCFVEKATLFYRPHNFELISPLYSHLEDCNYLTGNCNMADNTTLNWETECKENCKPCDYHFVESMDGEHTGSTDWAGGTWISKSKEQALTFSKEAKMETACNGKPIRLSDQSFGILEDEYLKIINDRGLGKRAIQEEQLAAQLTAGQLATSRSIAQLFSKECRRSSRGGNPTIQARRLLRRKDVMARWLNEDTMQIFSCAEFSMQNVEYQAVNNCYRYIPVQIRIEKKTLNAFLDPELHILTASSPYADCGNFRYHYLQLSQSNWIKIDTRTATIQKIDSSSISEIHEAAGDPSLLEITPLIFHRWTIDNETGEGLFAHLDEWLRLDQWKTKEKEHKTARALTLGALPSGVIGLTEEWFMDKLRLLISYWTTACCIYVTFIFGRDVLIPLVWVYLMGPVIVTIRNLVTRNHRTQRNRAARGTWRAPAISRMEAIELVPPPMPQDMRANETTSSQKEEPEPSPLVMELKRQMVAFRSKRRFQSRGNVATERQPRMSVERTNGEDGEE
ncbi:hypothetical protein niasHS_004989 [Heterodera schachtii]|uniref:Endonuclease n=1 Tax=Heterodera schachtii TaxID=97005 RepID=A0ABD2JQV9_HETSC